MSKSEQFQVITMSVSSLDRSITTNGRILILRSLYGILACVYLSQGRRNHLQYVCGCKNRSNVKLVTVQIKQQALKRNMPRTQINTGVSELLSKVQIFKFKYFLLSSIYEFISSIRV